MVYTPMGGSLTINVLFCPYFTGLPKIKAQPFTLVVNLIVKPQENKLKIKSIIGHCNIYNSLKKCSQ